MKKSNERELYMIRIKRYVRESGGKIKWNDSGQKKKKKEVEGIWNRTDRWKDRMLLS